MCPNGWGGKLCDHLQNYLRETSPDVLCLQEVVHTPDTQQGWLTYRDGEHVLPQRANFFRDVCEALPGHTATFCPAAQGVLWDYERGWPVTIAHMHSLRDRRGKMDTPERMQQAQRLASLATGVSEPGDRLIICGDFNVEPDSQTFEVFSEIGMDELVTGRGFSGTRSSHYKNRAGSPITCWSMARSRSSRSRCPNTPRSRTICRPCPEFPVPIAYPVLLERTAVPSCTRV
nr:endonuclease/exonuclease/phosphatase family protein [Marinicella sp. W31]MDC2875548.1 endonuclease/exonuclease/phosphatase family protein [Marinicella sp. W31]